LAPIKFTKMTCALYRITDTFELYSVGPDGVDDGGKAVARGRWNVRQPKGDVPAGVR